MSEMQTECFTPLRKAKPGELGSMSMVLRLIDQSRPVYITISEAKPSATTSENSNFAHFIGRINALGYDIVYDEDNFESDEEAEQEIETFRVFYEGPLKTILERLSYEDPTFFEEAGRAAEAYYSKINKPCKKTI